MADEVCSLGRDLAAQNTFDHWAVDITSPGLLEMLRERAGALVAAAGAPYVFGPPEGPPFFEQCGWRPETVHSLLKTARRLGRLPLMLRMIAMLPESTGAQGSRPWAGVVVLKRST